MIVRGNGRKSIRWQSALEPLRSSRSVQRRRIRRDQNIQIVAITGDLPQQGILSDQIGKQGHQITDKDAVVGNGTSRQMNIDQFQCLSAAQHAQRLPNSADPTRTWVAPMAMAVSKSPLMPMESCSTPAARPNVARCAK